MENWKKMEMKKKIIRALMVSGQMVLLTLVVSAAWARARRRI